MVSVDCPEPPAAIETVTGETDTTGQPLQLALGCSEILPEKLAILPRLIVAVEEPPGATYVGLGAVDEIEKSAMTVTVMIREWVSEPLVPVTVMVYVPVGVEAAA